MDSGQPTGTLEREDVQMNQQQQPMHQQQDSQYEGRQVAFYLNNSDGGGSSNNQQVIGLSAAEIYVSEYLEKTLSGYDNDDLKDLIRDNFDRNLKEIFSSEIQTEEQQKMLIEQAMAQAEHESYQQLMEIQHNEQVSQRNTLQQQLPLQQTAKKVQSIIQNPNTSLKTPFKQTEQQDNGQALTERKQYGTSGVIMKGFNTVHDQMNVISNIDSDEGENEDSDDQYLQFQIDPNLKQQKSNQPYGMNFISQQQQRQTSILGQSETIGSSILNKFNTSSRKGLLSQSNKKNTLSSRYDQEEEKYQKKGTRGPYKEDKDFRETRDKIIRESIEEHFNLDKYSMKRVPVREMQQKIKSKQQLYNCLLIEGQYYLPPYEDCSVEFLADCLAARKRLLQNDQVKIIRVPKLQELSVKQLQAMALADDEICAYLPTNNPNKPFNRDFLFNIINTVNPDFFPENIKGCMKLRQEKQADKNNKVIIIAPEFQDLIFNTMTQSKNNRGRAVHLLSAGAKRTRSKRSRAEAGVDLYQISSLKRFKGNNFPQQNDGEMISIRNPPNIIASSSNQITNSNSTLIHDKEQ